MVGPSKILTVSYGTFSCTLEGFDDPFSTMKSIAEYFRDLAADDRYFGAEPPQPDPAMLHRIAEREVHRRVEARVQDNGVILRAADAPAGTGPAAPSYAPSYVPAYVPAGAASPLSESVAAKLQRLRHAATAAPALASVLAPVADEAEIMPEPPAPAVEAAIETTAIMMAEPAETPVAPVAEPEPELAAEAAPEALPKAEDPIEAAPEAEPADAPAQDDDIIADAMPDVWKTFAADDLAAMPDDAEATAAMAEAIEDWTMPEAEAEAPAPVTAERDVAPLAAAAFDDDADLMESLAAALAGPADEIAPVAQATLAADDTEDAMLAALIDDFNDAPEATAVEAAVSDTAERDSDADDAAFEAALLAATGAEPAPMIEDEDDVAAVTADDELAAETAFNTAATEVAEVGANAAPADNSVLEEFAPQDVSAAAETAPEPAVAETADAAEVASSTVSADKLQRARARVIKIRRAEPLPPVAALAPEVEEDLAQELDALKADAPLRPQLPEVSTETSVQRLIDQTNTQLDGVENRRRHAAIEHLKAAVAATAAERRATGGAEDPAEATRLNAYRSDLERVVRPRRPVAAATQSDAPAAPTARPAPLVLVSAQRIDRPASPAQPMANVRPRRVAGGALALSPETEVEDDDDAAADDENMFTPAHGFAEFAERLGAQELPDLLEAAVAYAACVEGRPHVSRPYMLRQVGTIVSDGEAKRDEMLQGFGRLLRHGKIEKVRAGLYALPGSSRMMAEAKKIAV